MVDGRIASFFDSRGMMFICFAGPNFIRCGNFIGMVSASHNFVPDLGFGYGCINTGGRTIGDLILLIMRTELNKYAMTVKDRWLLISRRKLSLLEALFLHTSEI